MTIKRYWTMLEHELSKDFEKEKVGKHGHTGFWYYEDVLELNSADTVKLCECIKKLMDC